LRAAASGVWRRGRSEANFISAPDGKAEPPRSFKDCFRLAASFFDDAGTVDDAALDRVGALLVALGFLRDSGPVPVRRLEPRCRLTDLAGQVEFDLLREQVVQEVWLVTEKCGKSAPTTGRRYRSTSTGEYQPVPKRTPPSGCPIGRHLQSHHPPRSGPSKVLRQSILVLAARRDRAAPCASNFAIPNFGPSTYNKEEVRPDGASARCCSELIQGALRLAIARSIRKWTPWLSTRKSPIVERPHVERRGVWGRDRLLVKNLSRECRRTLSAALSAIDRSIRSTVSGKQRSRPIASKRPRRS
jgi:hypothetical protein